MRWLGMINLTWENLQIAKHKSVRWAERKPSWFVLCDLQIFSGKVYHPEPPHAQSVFLFPIVLVLIVVVFQGSWPSHTSMTFNCHTPALTLSRAGFFASSGGQGGGGGAQSAPLPLVKTLFPFSESTQVKFFWKLVQNWVLWSKFGFHGNHGYGFNPFTAKGRIYTSQKRPSRWPRTYIYVQPQFRFYASVKARPPTWLLLHVSEVSSSSVRWSLLALLGFVHWENSSSMLRAVFVQMAGNSVVDVPRCDGTSWYELYVWMLSRRRRSRRELVSSSWKRGRREWRWRLAGRGNWWQGRLVRKNWPHCQQWTKTSVFQLTVNARLRRGIDHTLERPSKVKKKKILTSPSLLLVFSRWALGL